MSLRGEQSCKTGEALTHMSMSGGREPAPYQAYRTTREEPIPKVETYVSILLPQDLQIQPVCQRDPTGKCLVTNASGERPRIPEHAVS